jgi:hypothetical protein
MTPSCRRQAKRAGSRDGRKMVEETQVFGGHWKKTAKDMSLNVPERWRKIYVQAFCTATRSPPVSSVSAPLTHPLLKGRSVP